MQARYRKLYPLLWQHASFRALSTEARLVALYLLTGPQTNRLGFYRLSVGEALEDLSLTLARFRTAIVAVTRAFAWQWDETARVVWISSWWTWNPPEAPNNLRGALKDYIEVPASRLAGAFIEATRPLAERLEVPLPTPSAIRAEPVPNPYRTQDQEQEQEQEQEPSTSSSSADDAGDGFDAFWSSYPRKVGKAAAAKAWRRLRPAAARRAGILAAIAMQRTSAQWQKDGGQYIPHPATWLREGRWDDVPTIDVAPALLGVGRTAGNGAALRAYEETLADVD